MELRASCFTHLHLYKPVHAVGLTTPNSSAVIDPSMYYGDVNQRFENYYGAHDNAVLFLVQSDQHCYTPNNFMYTATTQSKQGGGRVSMLDYMKSLPLNGDDDSGVSGQCYGDEVALDDKPEHSTRYCDETLAGRTVESTST